MTSMPEDLSAVMRTRSGQAALLWRFVERGVIPDPDRAHVFEFAFGRLGEATQPPGPARLDPLRKALATLGGSDDDRLQRPLAAAVRGALAVSVDVRREIELDVGEIRSKALDVWLEFLGEATENALPPGLGPPAALLRGYPLREEDVRALIKRLEEIGTRLAIEAIAESGLAGYNEASLAWLFEMLGDHQNYRFAASVLGGVGNSENRERVLLGLLSRLKNSDLTNEILTRSGFGSPLLGYDHRQERLDPPFLADRLHVGALAALGRFPAGPVTDAVRDLLLADLQDARATRRQQAMWILAKLGPSAWSADVVEGLEDGLSDDSGVIRVTAIWALGQVGRTAERREHVIGCLTGVLSNAGPVERRWVCATLADLVADGDSWAATAISSLDDPDPSVRRAAAKALGRLQSTRDGLLALLEGQGDPEEEVRLECARALGALSPEEPLVGAGAILARHIAHSDWHVRHLAALATERYPRLFEADPPIDACLRQARHVDPDFRAKAATGLGQIATGQMSEVSRALIALAGDPEEEVRTAACSGLAALGEAGEFEEQLAALRLGVADEARGTRSAALASLRALLPASATFETAALLAEHRYIEERLVDGDVDETLDLVFEAMSNQDAIRPVAARLRDPDVETRCLAGWLVASQAIDLGPDCVPLVLAAVDDHDENARAWAVTALSRCADERVASVLLTHLTDPSPSVRVASIYSIGVTATILPGLRFEAALLDRAVRDENDSVRAHALAALAERETHFLPDRMHEALRAGLVDPSEEVRFEAVDAFSAPPVAAAITDVHREALVACLGDADFEVRMRAAAVLAGLGVPLDFGEVVAEAWEAVDLGGSSARQFALDAICDIAAVLPDAIDSGDVVAASRCCAEQGWLAARVLGILGILGFGALKPEALELLLFAVVESSIPSEELGTHSSSEVGEMATDVITYMLEGDAREDLLASLVTLLDSPDPETRRRAARVLGVIGRGESLADYRYRW